MHAVGNDVLNDTLVRWKQAATDGDVETWAHRATPEFDPFSSKVYQFPKCV